MGVEVVRDGLTIETRGLRDLGISDIEAKVDDFALVDDAEGFLRRVLEYIRTSVGASISDGETISCGYWMVLAKKNSKDILELWEYDRSATEFVPGVSLTMRYWRDQNRVCDQHGAEFSPPRPDQLVVVSDGVFEGDDAEGVRYPSPSHMSGWWITTNRYDGNVKSLRREHLYHLTSVRDDLVQYLSLPFGYRFRAEPSAEVWFDQNALK